MEANLLTLMQYDCSTTTSFHSTFLVFYFFLCLVKDARTPLRF